MVCFSYTIVNTLHKRDDKHDDNNNNYYFRFIFVYFEGGCLSVRRHQQRCAVSISLNTVYMNPRQAELTLLHVSTIIQLYRA